MPPPAATPTFNGTNPNPSARRFSPAGMAVVIAVHAAGLLLLLSLDWAPLPPPPTLMVQIIPPEPVPAPQITPPRPRPVERTPAPPPRPVPQVQPQTLAAAASAPAAVAEVPAVKEAPPAAPAPAPMPQTVSQARFDADYLNNPAPAYPPLSRRLGEEGKVMLRVFVEPSGRPNQVEIKAGSGWPRLDQAALEAVRRWQFIPARRGDEAVGAWVLVPIVFNMKD